MCTCLSPLQEGDRGGQEELRNGRRRGQPARDRPGRGEGEAGAHQGEDRQEAREEEAKEGHQGGGHGQVQDAVMKPSTEDLETCGSFLLLYVFRDFFPQFIMS